MPLKVIFIVTVSILSLFNSALAQQEVEESSILQMRATVQKLEGLSGDANIPVETRQQLSELLFEKRGELHALLRQKRDALRSRLQNPASAMDQANLAEMIRRLAEEMQQLSGTIKVAAVTTASGPTHAANTGNGTVASFSNDGASAEEAPAAANGTSNSSNPTSSATSVSSPVVVQPTATQPALIAAQPPAGAQDPCLGINVDPRTFGAEYAAQIHAAACRIFKAKNNLPRSNPIDATVAADRYTLLMVLAITRKRLSDVAIPELVAQAENASNSKNLSASGSSAGSTSLVSKAGLPAVFGFAVEHGGLTRDINGTTVTFTGNPVGLVQTMANKGFISSYQNQDDFTKFLRKFSFGLSFDTSRGSEPGVFTGSKQQLSGFSFKYNIVDQRDPRDSRFTSKWLDLTQKQAANLAASLSVFVDDVRSERIPGVSSWQNEVNTALASATNLEQIKTVLIAELPKLEQLPLTVEQQGTLEHVATDFTAFLDKKNDILREIQNGWIATLDYNNERPAGLPSLSNFRFLAEKGAYNGSIDFTGNASLTIYNSRPTTPNTQRLRDFRFAGQLDKPIGNVSGGGQFLLSFAGRYERLLNDEPIEGTTDVIKKGDIAVGQVKLTIPIRGTALKIPLSLTVANRTELIKEKEVRGNFGVTFDLDSLLAKFNPFSKP
jgi:hypothetical protein